MTQNKKNSDAKIRANNRYREKTYRTAVTYFKPEEMDILDDYCKKNGYSRSGFIHKTITEKIKKGSI